MGKRGLNDWVSKIQQSCDIVDVVSEHVRLDRKGREFVGLCPFHEDHKPSMYVSPEKQIFKCFACGAGGDVIKFIQLRENLDFRGAVSRLAERAGIELENFSSSKPKPQQGEFEPADIARVNDWAMRVWQANLTDEQTGKAAREYVTNRGINDESGVKFGLGLALDSYEGLLNKARAKKIPDKLLIDAGLAGQNETGRVYDRFRNRLIFPIVDVTNRVIGFGGRTLGDDSAKYLNSPATMLFDKSNSVYALNLARHEIVKSGTAVVVEGYTDVMMCHQFGVTNVVATLGTSFTAGHARILRRYARQIVLIFDSDIAGNEAANRAMDVCLTEGIDIRLGFVPSGKDPCDYLLESGADAFRGVVEQAQDVMEYTWQRLEEGLSSSTTVSERKGVVEEFIRRAALSIRSGRLDSLAKGLMISKLASTVGLTVRQINEQMDQTLSRIERMNKAAQPEQESAESSIRLSLYDKACIEILEVLLSEPELYREYRDSVCDIRFENEITRQMSTALFAALEERGSVSLSAVLAGIESTEAGAFCVAISDQEGKSREYRTRLEDALAVISHHRDRLEADRFSEEKEGDERLRAIAQIHEKRNQAKKNKAKIFGQASR